MNWLSLLGLEAFVARWRANVIEGPLPLRIAWIWPDWNGRIRSGVCSSCWCLVYWWPV